MPEPRLAPCEETEGSRCAAWAAVYDSGPYDYATASVASASGDRVFVTGIDYVSGGPADINTVAFDRAGRRLWVAEYKQSGSDYVLEVAVSPDESLVVVVGGLGLPNRGDAVAIAYDAATGQQRWLKTFDAGHGYDLATDVTFAPDGSAVYLSVLAKGPGNNYDWDYFTLSLDAGDGHERWATRNTSVASSGYDYALAVAASPDGTTVATTGWMQAADDDFLGYGTIAYDAATGATRWVSKHESEPQWNSSAFDVAFSSTSDAVYVTGISYRLGGIAGWVTASYESSSGEESWKDRYEGCGNCGYSIRTLALDRDPDPSDDRVYIGGWGNPGGEFEFIAVAYNAGDGGRAWDTHYQNGGWLIQAKVALSPDGSRLYLAGVTQTQRKAPHLVLNSVPWPPEIVCVEQLPPPHCFGLLPPVVPDYPYNETTIIALDTETGTLVWEAKPVFEEYEDSEFYAHWFDVRETYEWIHVSTAPGRVHLSNVLTRRSLWKVCCAARVTGQWDEFDTDYVTIAFEEELQT